MADKGSGGSRLPLALPPASQGCSSGGGGSSAGGSGNPRPPRNLQGLLQMAITAGSEEPDPPPEPMSEERRQWLQEAMSAAFRGQREEVEQMKSCLRVLSQPTPPTAGEAELATDQQEREGALELLADLCENMDNAADFCQLSGMHLLVGRYLEAGAAGLRWRAAQLIGTCSQNVAAIQEQVLGLGALRKLLRLLDRDSCDTVRVKALFAISCLVREQEAGLLQFLRLDGFSVLMRAMQQQVQKLKVKSAFLLQNLLVGHPEHKGTLCSMGMVQQLVALVRTEHSPFHEHVLGALCSLVTDFPQGVRECREPELGLEELLRHRCQLLQQHEEYQGAMFWKFDLHTSSHLDTLLEKEDLSLPELLDEEDVLQECKVVNLKLLDFLLQPPHLQAMVAWVTQEPPSSGEERLRYKYPSVACEILTSDVPQINDALGADESLLNRLYGFLQSGDNLNPLLASFFSKVMGILINRKTDQLVSFLRKKDDFVDLLLRHIGTSAIMDLLLRLLTCVERPQLRQDVFNWLNEEKIVQRLIEQIHPSKDDNQHSNASQSLCDIIRLSREQMIQGQDSPEPDQLLATLEKQETIEQLLSNMFEGEQCQSVIVSGIQVLLTLLEPRRPRSDSVTMNNFFSSVDGQLELLAQGALDNAVSSMGALHALRPRLARFHQLLLEPPKLEPLQMTWGSLAQPLGNTRLHVVKLLASALSTNAAALTQELLALDVPNTLLDLFFHYVFNNFLHAQVEVCVSAMLSSGPPPDSSSETPIPNPILKHLLQHCRLVERILASWEDNDNVQSGGGPRKGYMGHLTRVANAVVQNTEQGPNAEQLGQLLKELPEDQQQRWEAFVTGPLAETNKKNTVDLVNTHHLHSSSDDEDDRLKEFNFPEEAVLQQAFMDFQMQRMTSAFIDHFGFNDEEFGEQEESVNAPFDKTANITFSLNADDENPNANLLEICYKDRIQQFDDDEEEEEEGHGSAESDGEYGAWQGSQPARASHAGQPPGVRSGGSTDSEDDEDEEEEDEDEGAGQAACGRTSPSSFPSPGPQPPGPSWTATFEPVPMDVPTGPSVSKETDTSSTQILTSPPAHSAPQLRSQDPTPPSAPQEVTESSKVAELLAPCQALVSVADVQATLHGMSSASSSLDSTTREPSTSVPAFEAQQSPQTVEGEKGPEPLGPPQSQSAQALEMPNGSTPGGPISSGSQ